MTPPATGSRALPAPRRDWAYFFDIDGTLMDIAMTPAGARPEPALSGIVVDLYREAGGAVALISGRAIRDIDRIFPGVRLPVAGQHGGERRDAAGRLSHHVIPAGGLDEIRRMLRAAVARHPGLLLEDKGLSVALHYRRVPRMGSYAHRLFRSAFALSRGEFSLIAGKRVIEMKPAGRDKGAAVLEFMQEHPFRGRRPVFVGDDVTDEFGFAAVNRLDGVSIKVGPGKTVARYRLATVRAVREWLERGSFGI